MQYHRPLVNILRTLSRSWFVRSTEKYNNSTIFLIDLRIHFPRPLSARDFKFIVFSLRFSHPICYAVETIANRDKSAEKHSLCTKSSLRKTIHTYQSSPDWCDVFNNIQQFQLFVRFPAWKGIKINWNVLLLTFFFFLSIQEWLFPRRSSLCYPFYWLQLTDFSTFSMVSSINATFTQIEPEFWSWQHGFSVSYWQFSSLVLSRSLVCRKISLACSFTSEAISLNQLENNPNRVLGD